MRQRSLRYDRGRGNVLRGVLSFMLVLVLTVGTVAVLSRATAARAETAPARYAQDLRESQGGEEGQEAEVLSAAAREESGSPLVNVGAFLLVLCVPAVGVGAARSFRRGEKSRREPRPQRGAAVRRAF